MFGPGGDVSCYSCRSTVSAGAGASTLFALDWMLSIGNDLKLGPPSADQVIDMRTKGLAGVLLSLSCVSGRKLLTGGKKRKTELGMLNQRQQIGHDSRAIYDRTGK